MLLVVDLQFVDRVLLEVTPHMLTVLHAIPVQLDHIVQ
jgi:hypothetical protein